MASLCMKTYFPKLDMICLELNAELCVVESNQWGMALTTTFFHVVNKARSISIPALHNNHPGISGIF